MTNKRSNSRQRRKNSKDKRRDPAMDAFASGTRKIHDYHLERLAVVYVRQSSPRQVEEHRESRDLQYGLTRLAEQYGWSEDRIVVIDDDQGQSGKTADCRLGFQQLIAEVSLDHVGLVLGIEMSRLARSNKDWHQLLELCGIFRCLLADPDGLYDPTEYNDRLLLGLRGMMSEAELHILRGRMYQAALNKARRGELFTHVPIGYIRNAHGEAAKDPDPQVQDAVKLVFQEFDRLESAMSLLRFLREHEIRLPIRPIYGSNKGQIEWRQAVYSTIVNMLHNPTYAGSYAYGRFQTDPRRLTAGKTPARFRADIEDWKVLIHDKLPAYITWEQYLANVDRLKENSSAFEATGPAREGEALLAGIIFCGQCGRRMFPHYKGKAKPAAYVCPGNYPSGGDSSCQRVASRFVDDLVVKQVMYAIEPASLELSLRATEEIRKQQAQVQAQWKRRLQDADDRSNRVRQQFDAVDPTNRRVAAKLERQWEEVLCKQRRLEEEYDRFVRDQSARPSPKDMEAIERLATDIPFLWEQSPQFSADHKQIVRHLLDRVVIEIQDKSEVVDVAIGWQGGFETRHELIRSVARYDQLQNFDQLKARVNQLWRSGRSTTAIAKALNVEGFRTTTAGKEYTRHTVRKLLDSWELTEPQRGQIPAELAALDTDEWWLLDLSVKLSIDRNTLARWCRRGWAHARQLSGQRRWWIIWADDDECDRLRRLYEHGRGWPRHNGSPYPQELKTPKQKPTYDS